MRGDAADTSSDRGQEGRSGAHHQDDPRRGAVGLASPGEVITRPQASPRWVAGDLAILVVGENTVRNITPYLQREFIDAGVCQRQRYRSGAPRAQEEVATRRSVPRDEAPPRLREAVGTSGAGEGRRRASAPESATQAHGARGLLAFRTPSLTAIGDRDQVTKFFLDESLPRSSNLAGSSTHEHYGQIGRDIPAGG